MPLPRLLLESDHVRHTNVQVHAHKYTSNHQERHTRFAKSDPLPANSSHSSQCLTNAPCKATSSASHCLMWP